MAHIDFKILNNLQLESDELHIVLKALSGELTDEERAEAKKLHDTILEMRNSRAKLWVEKMKRAEKK